jgi:hypothetical protein
MVTLKNWYFARGAMIAAVDGSPERRAKGR